MSGDMDRQKGTELGRPCQPPREPIPHLDAGAKSLPIRQRKGRKLDGESDEAIVPTMGMQHNILGGKGLC